MGESIDAQTQLIRNNMILTKDLGTFMKQTKEQNESNQQKIQQQLRAR